MEFIQSEVSTQIEMPTGERNHHTIRLFPVKLEKYPIWNIHRVESSDPHIDQISVLESGGITWYRVDLPGGVFVVPDRKQQSEINLSLKMEASR